MSSATTNQTVAIVRQLERKLNKHLPVGMNRGAFYADLADIHEISTWYIATLDQLLASRMLTNEQLEDVLIALDVQLLSHMKFHLASLKKLLPHALKAVDSSKAKPVKPSKRKSR